MENKLPIAIDQTMLVPWYKRLLNLVIDAIVVAFIFVLLGIIGIIFEAVGYPSLLEWMLSMNSLTDRFVTTMAMISYLFVIESFTQRSIGKFITGTIIVSEDGSKPGIKSFLIRALCRILWIEVLSFINAFPRGWHDTASNTYVVDRKKYKEALALHDSFEEIGNSEFQNL